MNLALLLTTIRIVASPLLLAPLIAYNAPVCILLPCYIALAVTDFFDGFYARLYGTVSRTGALLDHVADKVLICCVLIPLIFMQRCPWWCGLLVVIREIGVMGLREYALLQQISVPVSTAAKYKTTFQLLYGGWLLVQGQSISISLVLGGAMLILSYSSAYRYYRQVMAQSTALSEAL